MPPYMPLIANPTTSLQLSPRRSSSTGPTSAPDAPGQGLPTIRTSWDGSPRRAWATGSSSAWSRSATRSGTGSRRRRSGGSRSLRDCGQRRDQGSDGAGHPDGDGLHPFDLTQTPIRKSKNAYPGAMVVYTAAKTYGLAPRTAQDGRAVHPRLLDRGPAPGRGNGQLAAGYLPITKSGVTATALRPGAGGRDRRGSPAGTEGAERPRGARRRARGVRRSSRRTEAPCRARHLEGPRRPRRRHPARRRRATVRRRSRTRRWSRRRLSPRGPAVGCWSCCW